MSINRFGTGSGNDVSGGPEGLVISADGRFVAFRSGATDLVTNDTNGTSDVFVRPSRPEEVRNSGSFTGVAQSFTAPT